MIRTLIVEKVGRVQESKFRPYPYQLVILKDIDSNETYKLNLAHKQDSNDNWTSWLNLLKLGNILECTMQADYPTNVNQWVLPRLLKAV